jgi:hypothetical protein
LHGDHEEEAREEVEPRDERRSRARHRELGARTLGGAVGARTLGGAVGARTLGEGALMRGVAGAAIGGWLGIQVASVIGAGVLMADAADGDMSKSGIGVGVVVTVIGAILGAVAGYRVAA